MATARRDLDESAPVPASCLEIRALMDAEALGSPDPARAERIEMHVRDCGECRALIEGPGAGLRDPGAVLSRLEIPTPSEAEWDAIGRRLAAEPRAGTSRAGDRGSGRAGRRRYPSWLPALAAAMLLAVLIPLGLLERRAPPAEPTPSLAREIEILDLGKDSQYMIFAPTEEGGAALIWVSAG